MVAFDVVVDAVLWRLVCFDFTISTFRFSSRFFVSFSLFLFFSLSFAPLLSPQYVPSNGKAQEINSFQLQCAVTVWWARPSGTDEGVSPSTLRMTWRPPFTSIHFFLPLSFWLYIFQFAKVMQIDKICEMCFPIFVCTTARNGPPPTNCVAWLFRELIFHYFRFEGISLADLCIPTAILIIDEPCLLQRWETLRINFLDGSISL